MAYAKFITRVNSEGKSIRYGPYYYKSVRMEEGRRLKTEGDSCRLPTIEAFNPGSGKVRNIYLGTRLREKEGANGMRWVRDALAGLRRL